ncbi:allantoinase AllB [Qingshengfaniella alkalisoli]|uniref:Allantoinase AllB n=1 Tax=Qingshengfaniella alkalisoli TaxID=2599296 RepID=A0A5B8IAH9_9RHOB|nr:allantoinase AllB [Qingshengfaniella alkalisoli]QDY71079.1 allantoinase AllB [Qingshengfaniella alkalisoli]
MSPEQTYLRNAQLVTEDGIRHGGVVIEAGQIAEVVSGNPDRAANDVIDAEGLPVLPGLVDMHVHFSEPGRGHWEGFETGSRAAAAGGITTVVEMPLNAVPPTVDPAALSMKLHAAQKSIVDYALWGGVVGGDISDIEGLAEGGVAAFKAFMCPGSPEFPHVGSAQLQTGLDRIARLKMMLAVHAEDEALTERLTRDLRASGRVDPRAWGEARPIEAELWAIRNALAAAKQAGARLHIVHVSTAAGIDLVHEARQTGQQVTAETCAHYLAFDEEDLVRGGPEFKCAPPLRAPEERENLWQKVLAGQVDAITSDHSPCLLEDKEKGAKDIFEAWGGISGLQSGLPAMLTEGVGRRGLSLPDLVRMMSASPARIMGLFPRKGSIAVGSDADLVIVDPSARFTLQTDDLEYRNPHSAYVGHEFTGKVVRTIRRGETLFSAGRIVAHAGPGSPLLRSCRV